MATIVVTANIAMSSASTSLMGLAECCQRKPSNVAEFSDRFRERLVVGLAKQNVSLAFGCRRFSSLSAKAGRRGGAGLVLARSGSGGTNKQRQEEQRSIQPPISSPPPPTSSSSKLPIPEEVNDDPAAAVVDVADEVEVQDAKEERESSSSGAESADKIGKAISELRRDRVVGSLQDSTSTSGFWKGVVEETQLIEWPVFSKVLGTTGVVMAMIIGSSVVLLTVNAILAASSDFIFNDPAFRDFAKSYLNLVY